MFIRLNMYTASSDQTNMYTFIIFARNYWRCFINRIMFKRTKINQFHSIDNRYNTLETRGHSNVDINILLF